MHSEAAAPGIHEAWEGEKAVLSSHTCCDFMQEAAKVLQDKFKTGKSRWFFSKLRF